MVRLFFMDCRPFLRAAFLVGEGVIKLLLLWVYNNTFFGLDVTYVCHLMPLLLAVFCLLFLFGKKNQLKKTMLKIKKAENLNVALNQ